jgi:aquaporin Z
MTTSTLLDTHESVTTVAEPRPAVKYATEAIGTMFLVLTIGAVTAGASALAPLAIGGVLMAMIYAGRHISGGHYNPAVTLAALVRGRIGDRDAVAYWVSQCVAAVLAAGIVAVVSPVHVTPLSLSGHAIVAACVAELLFTFALCFVVLNVATSKDHPDNSFYGLAIGLVVMAGAVSVGAISGGAFNPAVVLGGVAMGTISVSLLVPYVLTQLAAGVAAGIAFRAINPADN